MDARKQHHQYIIYGKNPVIHAAAIQAGGTHMAQPNKLGAGNIWREQLAPTRALQRTVQRGRTAGEPQSRGAAVTRDGWSARLRRATSPASLPPVAVTMPSTSRASGGTKRITITYPRPCTDRRCVCVHSTRSASPFTRKHLRIIGGRGEKRRLVAAVKIKSAGGNCNGARSSRPEGDEGGGIIWSR